MASSPLSSKKPRYHARSVSSPSLSHPLVPQFNEHLCRLKASEANSSSFPSTSNRLSGLEDLYNSVDDLLLLPHAQQDFTQECNRKCVDEALDGYLSLLDVCATTKDIFSQTKQDVRELISILRRRREANYFSTYSTSAIKKSLKDLKSIGKKQNEVLGTIGMLKEVEAVTLVLFESLLSSVAGTKVQSSSWSLVSKLMHHKNMGCKGTVANEFEMMETALDSLINYKKIKSDDYTRQIENVQNQLVKMESSIQNLEGGLEWLFRRLIKTRVSLLNILSH